MTPYPATTCISINHVVCHGIPSDKKILKAGDIVNIDVTSIKNGYHGDTSRMFVVGKPTIAGKRLVDLAFGTMWAGIDAVRPGGCFNDIGHAHARICSILKKMESEGVQFAGAEKVDATLLTEPSEMDLIRMLAAFPQEIVMAAEKYDPSRINRFVIDLASAFHRFYGSCRIQGADPAVQQARLALCIGVKNAIFNVLTMFKINVPEKM